jgi:hypothetical protein
MPARSTSRPRMTLGLVLLALACTACSHRGERHQRPDSVRAPARINHVVFFGLLDPADSGALVEDCQESLSEIPGVVSLFCGRHVEAGRASVLSDYDVCLYVGFDSLADYDLYVDHPNHTGLVDRWKSRFDWYRVYDVEDSSARESAEHGS